MGILISIPIAIVYNLVISKLSHMITSDYAQKEQIQMDLLISIIGGIAALAIGYYVFGNEKIENKIVKFGLIGGGILLLIYSTVYNWNTLEDLTKLLFLSASLFFIIIVSYKYINSEKRNEKKKEKKIHH